MPFERLFARALELSVARAGSVRYDSAEPEQLMLMGLYGSIIDVAHSMKTLVDNQAATGVPILLRSLLEAWVELRLLHDDAEYVRQMRFLHNREWGKRLQRAASGNSYLSLVAAHEDFERSRASHAQRVASDAAAGASRLSIEQKFTRAGLRDVYESVYSLLSDHVHSSLGALMSRHMELVDERVQLIFLRDPNPHSVKTYTSAGAEVLSDAGIRIHLRFKTGLEAPFIGLKERIASEIKGDNAED